MWGGVSLVRRKVGWDLRARVASRLASCKRERERENQQLANGAAREARNAEVRCRFGPVRSGPVRSDRERWGEREKGGRGGTMRREKKFGSARPVPFRAGPVVLGR